MEVWAQGEKHDFAASWTSRLSGFWKLKNNLIITV